MPQNKSAVCLFRKGRTMAEKDSATAIRGGGGLAEQTGGNNEWKKIHPELLGRILWKKDL